MPPKKKGKGKQVDPEAIRLQEEAERKALEERQLQEKMMKEKQFTEAMEALIGKELSRLGASLDDMNQLQSNVFKQWQTAEQHRVESAKWKRFSECERIPSSDSEKEINTYLTTWKDSLVIDHKRLNMWQEKLDEIESVCSALEPAAYNFGAMAISESKCDVPEALRFFREMILVGWDHLTAQIITHSDHFPQEQEENQQVAIQAMGNFCGIWNNNTRNPRFKVIEYTDKQISVSIPRPISQISVSVRVLSISQPSVKYSYFDPQLKAFPTVLGGVVHLSVYEFPEIPKRFNGWSVRPFNSGSLQKVSYPLPAGMAGLVVDDDDNAQQTWPFAIQYPLPKGCSIPAKECCDMCRWNPMKSAWTTDGIESVDFDFVQNIVSFQTQFDGQFALIQKPYCQYPLKSWHVECTDNTVKLCLNGQYSSIIVSVVDGKCTLASSEPIDFPHAAMEPAHFFEQLAFCGRDFIGPSLDNSNMRDKYIMKDLAFTISQLSHQFSFRSSETFRSLPSDRYVMEYRAADSATEAPWDSVAVWSKYSAGSTSTPLAYRLQSQVHERGMEPELEDVRQAMCGSFHVISETGGKPHTNSPNQLRAIYETLSITKPFS